MNFFQLLLLAASWQGKGKGSLPKAVIGYQSFGNPHVGDEPLTLAISSNNPNVPVMAAVATGSEGKISLSLVNGLYKLTAVGVASSVGIVLSQAESEGFLAADKVIITFSVLAEEVVQVGTVNVDSDGNSLNRGEGASDPSTKSPVGVLDTLLPDNYIGFANAAVSGQSVPQMIARFNQFVLPNYNSAAQSNILFMGDGVNDIIGNGTSPQDVFNTYKQYFAMAKNAGYKTIVQTTSACMKEYGIGIIAGENNRQELDRLVRAGWKTDLGCDGIVDVCRDEILGTYNPEFDRTYFIYDGQHFTDAGYARKAGLLKPAIEKIAQGKFYGVEEQQLKAPKVSLSGAVEKVAINYIASDGANNYIIVRNTTNEIDGATQIYSGAELSYVDESMIPGNPYFYFVKAQGAGKTDSPWYINDSVTAQEGTGGGTPVPIGNVAHYMADKGVTVNGGVFTWLDQSGNNRTLTNEGSNLPIKVAADLNALPTIKFNNSPLATSAAIGIRKDTPRTIMVIAAKAGEQQSILGIGTGSVGASAVGQYSDISFYNGGIIYHVGGTFAQLTGSPYDWQIITAIYDADGNGELYLNETKVSGTYATPNMLNGAMLRVGGGRYNGMGNLVDSRIAEIIVRDDDDEQARIDNYVYLKAKWNL